VAAPAAPATRRPVGLGARVLAALVLVVLTGVVTAWTVASLVAPRVFAQHLRMAGEAVTPTATDHIDEAFRSASGISLSVALLAATTVSVLASLYLTRRVVHSLRPVAQAAAEVAAGRYAVRLDRPGLGAEFDELTAAFNHMAGQLDQVEETRRRLLADLAHEVRTPVATLRAYLEGLEDGLASADAETLAVMQAQVARLSRLAADVSAVSRADEGRRDLQPVPVGADALLESARSACAEAFRGKAVELVVASASASLVLADVDRLGQVLTNLLFNALRYSPPGSRVTLSAADDGGDVLLRVSDQGVGIAPEHLPHVFERFYRADAARDRAHGGSGIGLAIVKALVEAHDGRVSVASGGAGCGSEFTVRLPGIAASTSRSCLGTVAGPSPTRPPGAE
jgi:two-component system, OmpR family, sensor histidine kinase BaeS